MYRNGRGVPLDPVEAHKWIILGAATVTHPEAATEFAAGRDRHARELTSAQVAEANERARHWMDAFRSRMEGGVSGGVVGGVVGALPPPPPPNAPIRVGGSIKAPKQLKHVPPVYPDIAKQARVQGVVILECTVGPDGRVVEVGVLRSIPLLDQAAIDAVRQWEYAPTLLNGVPAPVILTVTVSFTLS